MDGVIKDPNLAPNHSFRHYLKSELLARDVPERISDAITGHKTPGIGRKYEHVPMSKKFDAISKLPVILLHTVRDFGPRNEPDRKQRHHGARVATR